MFYDIGFLVFGSSKDRLQRGVRRNPCCPAALYCIARRVWVGILGDLSDMAIPCSGSLPLLVADDCHVLTSPSVAEPELVGNSLPTLQLSHWVVSVVSPLLPPSANRQKRLPNSEIRRHRSDRQGQGAGPVAGGGCRNDSSPVLVFV